MAGLAADGYRVLGHDPEPDLAVGDERGQVAVRHGPTQPVAGLVHALALRSRGHALDLDEEQRLGKSRVGVIPHPVDLDGDFRRDHLIDQGARPEAARDLATELGQDLRIAERGIALVAMPVMRQGKNGFHGYSSRVGHQRTIPIVSA